jgi:amyloid beta precursor protein binding protein 1
VLLVFFILDLISLDMATADKYDRQLRLWGAGGQRRLMQSHILLVNADAVGTETLKNLVLPGVGKFTILDNKLLTPQDSSANFFQPEIYIGKLRGDVSRDTLCEMNPDVQGFSLISTLEAELEKGE